ncbi:phosphomannomutase [Falsirhodobacter halotolerans]|uniref:phosphomannomutase n=1 Tax=Falsirhodobacter halotolerans TaxID=1146892 RepID=UPI001FD5E7FA|nr:phosphomannomutase [Falsirhodobacter halotolerans]MCJ8140753.1 phosphomannomutase [Falsirhodobacter halotolerans]
MPMLTCFKTYDIRGRVGVDLDTGIARRIGAGFAAHLSARTVVLGRDNRASSGALDDAVAAGLMAQGVEVLDIGLGGTEEVYAATDHFGADGGIMITASHNPIDYNGMKMVGARAAPLPDLSAIRDLADADRPATGEGVRRDVQRQARAAYVDRVAGFVDRASLRPLHIVVDAGNGAAGPTFDALAEALSDTPLTFTRIRHAPDGTFPHGIPNPLLPENRHLTAEAVRTHGADMGVAWDGDFDRCFLFDAQGNFIDGEYIVSLLAEVFLAREPGATIVHDPRIQWATQDAVARAGGRAVASRTGHVFLKQALRDMGAVYGGEMSAHHYFRDFACCDSGMIPWLMVAELISRTGSPLADLVAARRAAFPSSGEINFRVAEAAAAVARVEAAFDGARDRTDGLSMDMGTWRFNLRASNTEPLLRLNVESRGNAGLVADKVAEITRILLP